MRLFSEKVSPTFTSSNLNILTVEDFQEVFFDVFEFEINGKKLIAEKVSEYKGSPVVDIPLVLEGKEFIAPFVLQRGSFEILFNKDNSSYVKDVVINELKPVFEHASESEKVEEIIFEKRENILSEIAQARQLAEKYADNIKQQKIDETTQYFNKRKELLEQEINESKKGLLDEFLTLVESVKSEFFEFNEAEKKKLSTFIEDNISNISDELIDSIDRKQKLAEEKFSEQINELATNVLTGVLLKEIGANNTKNIKDLNERFESITKSVKSLVDLSTEEIHERVNSKLNEYGDAIVNLEKVNIELNDQINKGDNRALSRIGNVKTQLEETISKNISDINDRFEATDKNIETLNESKTQLETLILESETILLSRVNEAEEKIKTFYNDKISLVEEKIQDLSLENKQYFLNLINESKQSLLNEIANIKVDVPNIVIEKSNGKQEVDLKGIKTELEKIIGTRFSNELQSLKRLIEMSSGGGSVAKQFAAGGTMEGTLNVTGQYLSAGVNLLDIFSGGGGGSADRLVNGSYQVSLCSNGDLAFPGGGYIGSQYGVSGWIVTPPAAAGGIASADGQQYIQINDGQGIFIGTSWPLSAHEWTFGRDGGLVFPDGSTQTTAFTNNLSAYATLTYLKSNFLNLSGGTITGATVINNNLTVNGNLTATGTTTFANTVFSVTSALSVVHIGSGPAVWVGNNGTGDIASFYDIDQNIEVLHVGGINSANPNVGIKTSTPNKTLTVVGEISSTSDITTSGKIYIQNDGNSDQWNSTYNTVSSLSSNWQTSYSLVSANNLVYTTEDQTIAGNKTFSNNVVINGQATAPNQTVTTDSDLTTLLEVEETLIWTPGLRIQPQPTAAFQLISGGTFSANNPFFSTSLATNPYTATRVNLVNGFTTSTTSGGTTNFSLPWKCRFGFHSIMSLAAALTSLSSTRAVARWYIGWSSSTGVPTANEEAIPAGASTIGFEHRVDPSKLNQHQLRMIARDGVTTSLGNLTYSVGSVSATGSISTAVVTTFTQQITAGNYPKVYVNSTTTPAPFKTVPDGTNIVNISTSGIQLSTAAAIAGSFTTRGVLPANAGTLITSPWIDYFANAASFLRQYDVVIENLGTGTANMYVNSYSTGDTTRPTRINRYTPAATLTGCPTGSKVLATNSNSIEFHLINDGVTAPATTTSNSMQILPTVTWI